MIENNPFGGRGRLIVLYGSNNLGKSKQLELLEGFWQEMGRPYTRLKYPIYESETGTLINGVLRPDKNGNRMAMCDEELQYWFAENRIQYEPELNKLLENGDVIAEDYKGTGFAWGLTKGVSRWMLDLFNQGIKDPDIAILLDGAIRFTGGIEKGHRHEAAGDAVWELSRRIHLELAREFGWEVVNANESEEKVHQNIMEIISRKW